MTFPRGFRAGGTICGIKPSGLPDLAIIAADRPCAAAGVFTRNRFPGEPVKVTRRHVRKGTARAIVCNSGVSNVATGEAGRRNALAMCSETARALGCEVGEVLVCSTGVIGRPLPMEKIVRGIRALAPMLSAGTAADAAAAKAILTTDLRPKTACETVRIGSSEVRLGGIAKGSGMIAPNMATMLVFVTTDAAIDAPLLQRALRHAVDHSFNRLTVDSDTSTSDSVLVLASGAAGNRRIDSEGKNFAAFLGALTEVCRKLAWQVIRDGEGVTKVFTVRVKNAASGQDADRAGRSIANSPLVKTAVHGGDPNWGRLVMAVGKSGARVRPERLSIAIEGTTVLRGGEPTALSEAAMKKLGAAMRGEHLMIEVDLGLGAGEAEWWGCDLSKEYVTINAEYTT